MARRDLGAPRTPRSRSTLGAQAADADLVTLDGDMHARYPSVGVITLRS